MITFGPLPSRRLGRSLGINNIIIPKSCSFACIYCQVGKTVRKTIRRSSFFEPETILSKVSSHIETLKKTGQPDYLTFVSNGEPTLDINLGKSISLLKKTGIPVAVITNASLLFNRNVRAELALADWVSLKVDAPDNITWQKVNKPSPELNYEKHIENIISFAAEFKGEIRTESMIVKGINDSENHFLALAGIIQMINPGIAYLAVPIRPPSEKFVNVPDQDNLNMAWEIFTERNIKTELLNLFEGAHTGFTGNIYEDILNITSVHPLREDSLENLLKRDNSDFSVVESLLSQKLIRPVLYNGKRFYIREYHS